VETTEANFPDNSLFRSVASLLPLALKAAGTLAFK